MKKRLVYLMGFMYIAAGVYHFINPDFYKRIMPPWLPFHDELVMISGACEILLGLLLLFPSTRRIGAWGVILLLIAVFPANIQMMLNDLRDDAPRLWLSVLRLPLQIVLVWWAYQYTGKKRMVARPGH